MDVSVNRGGSFTHPFPSHWNAFAYVFSGSGSIGGVSTDVQHAYVLEQGDFIEATTANAQVCNMGEKCYYPKVWIDDSRDAESQPIKQPICATNLCNQARTILPKWPYAFSLYLRRTPTSHPQLAREISYLCPPDGPLLTYSDAFDLAALDIVSSTVIHR
jgi:hypothetical protein